MSTYIIGDVQGCYDGLMKLLDKIQYNPNQDQLGFTGDLVQRGEDSLSVLRFIYKLEKPIIVLGNHDLHLLNLRYGSTEHKASDDLKRVLTAPDADELCEWLAQQPLLCHNTEHNFVMAHAGILPAWTLSEAKQYANEIESLLKNKDTRSNLLTHCYGNTPECWSNDLIGLDRYRFIINAFTRMRYCSSPQCIELEYKDKPGTQTNHLTPWFDYSTLNQQQTLIFGHWAALEGKCDRPNIHALDTGYVWGERLTALRLEDQALISVNNEG